MLEPILREYSSMYNWAGMRLIFYLGTILALQSDAAKEAICWINQQQLPSPLENIDSSNRLIYP